MTMQHTRRLMHGIERALIGMSGRQRVCGNQITMTGDLAAKVYGVSH
jgi:hypothetical protein